METRQKAGSGSLPQRNGDADVGLRVETTTGPVLDVEGLSVEFRTARGTVPAVRGVSLAVALGETLVVLGESGSGKSVTAEAIMGTIQTPPGHITAGLVSYRGIDILGMTQRQRRKIQGYRMAMVFQDPGAHLNPVFPVGWQIAETLRAHRRISARAAHQRAVELLSMVGLAEPDARAGEYPHQFSGGMKQRVMIAMAVALEPDVLLADEPTTALDVTVQAQILQLLARLRRETGMSLILITHDIGVAAEVADRVAVMYAGQVVEEGDVREVFSRPAHPYTRGLIACAPDHVDMSRTLRPLPGAPPDLLRIPLGCPFHPRCSFRTSECTEITPSARGLSGTHNAACHHADRIAADA